MHCARPVLRAGLAVPLVPIASATDATTAQFKRAVRSFLAVPTTGNVGGWGLNAFLGRGGLSWDRPQSLAW
eukprot:6584535-Pyramimonas_sp.AAC.1